MSERNERRHGRGPMGGGPPNMGNKSVGANTVRPSKEQAHNYNTVWQPKNLPTALVWERRNFCFTEMGVPFGEVTPWFWYLRC